MRFFSFFFLVGFLFISTSADAKRKPRNKFVEIETTMGLIKVELYNDVPQHAENFLKLAEEGFYDSILFHRVIPEFMIQGGDPKSKQALQGEMLGSGDIGYKIPAEFKDAYYHKRGALAAARDNNPEKASSGCQFYIVQGKIFSDTDLDGMEKASGRKFMPEARNDYKTIGGTPHLDGAYTVFGQVVEGLEVVEKITHVGCNSSNRPIEDIRILKTTVTRK
jgi:cyclophilin family peptidyl-prolyl cis-trans isomerase